MDRSFRAHGRWRSLALNELFNINVTHLKFRFVF